MVLKLRAVIGNNEFAIETDAAFSEIAPVFEKWLQVAAFTPPPDGHQQADLDALTTRVLKAKNVLATAVEHHQ